MKMEEKGSVIAIAMKVFTVAIASCFALLSCREVQLYERQKNIPGGEWKLDDKLMFSVNVPDSAKDYYIYATLRHTALYPYRNIWLRMGLQMPGSDSISYQNFNIPLANNEQWLGVGMNDVYERRVRLFGQPVKFSNKGDAVFSLQHIMRESELSGVLQAGIRIEPAE
jgi:gliding motility-associated lipoprotein GldH